MHYVSSLLHVHSYAFLLAIQDDSGPEMVIWEEGTEADIEVSFENASYIQIIVVRCPRFSITGGMLKMSMYSKWCWFPWLLIYSLHNTNYKKK